MKRIFVTDWALVPAFILSALTGTALHMAGHGGVHQSWHDWAVMHIAASLAFLSIGIAHVKLHWGWYKRLGRAGRRSRVTLLLSAAFVCASLSGLVLIGVEGTNSAIGLWHYKIGLALCACSVLHLYRRIPALARSLQRRKR